MLDATRGFARSATLPHPNMIWGLTILSSGDVVTACHDGAVRVWSRDATRVADASLVALLDEGGCLETTVTHFMRILLTISKLNV